MKTIQNETIISLLNAIESYGFEAYVVGGYVRNQLMGYPSYDYDIATSASVDDLLDIFKDEICDDQFIKFLRVDVMIDDIWFQITSFRKDSNYKNHRYPSKVKYAHDLESDSMRRDFSVNALYCDLNNHIYDFHHGLDDLKNKRIKTIKDADVSFDEDALRILRALRLMAQYDMVADLKLQEVMIMHFDELLSLRNARQYQQELEKMKQGRYYFELNQKLNSTLIDLIGQL